MSHNRLRSRAMPLLKTHQWSRSYTCLRRRVSDSQQQQLEKHRLDYMARSGITHTAIEVHKAGEMYMTRRLSGYSPRR